MATKKGKASRRIYLNDKRERLLKAYPELNFTEAAWKGVEAEIRRLELRKKSLDEIDLTKVAMRLRDTKNHDEDLFQLGYEAAKNWVCNGGASWSQLSDLVEHFKGYSEDRIRRTIRKTANGRRVWERVAEIMKITLGDVPTGENSFTNFEFDIDPTYLHMDETSEVHHWTHDWIMGWIIAVRDLHAKLKDLVEIDEVEGDKEES